LIVLAVRPKACAEKEWLSRGSGWWATPWQRRSTPGCRWRRCSSAWG